VSLRTPLCDQLDIEVPILLAPMAAGPSTPELAAAVTRAGGLGILGVTGLTAEVVTEQVRRARELCDDGPIGVNVQLAQRTEGAGTAEDMAAALAPFAEELGAETVEPPQADPPLALIEAALAAGATVASAALGDPAPVAPLARGAGVPLLAMVSSVAEAVQAVASGADVIVAQGMEAGGHRTTFEPEAGVPLVGTIALVPRVVDAVDVPVVAAGGIMDGRGIAAALALGAHGAMLGTRFLLAEEAGTPATTRRALAGLADTDTFVTDAVTGRPARWVRNRIATALHEGPPHLGWGEQRKATDPIRRAAAQADREDLLPMLAGQGAGMAKAVQPAEEIVRELVAGALSARG
jgi:nitronate monooxygenase